MKFSIKVERFAGIDVFTYLELIFNSRMVRFDGLAAGMNGDLNLR